MRNIFMMYIPPGNAQAQVNYDQTIIKKVAPERVSRYAGPALRNRLDKVFSGRPLTIWGSRDSSANRAKFERMRPGDEILVVEGSTIKLLGKIAASTVNPDLSHELWPPIQGTATQDWSLIYFIANPQQIDLPFVEFCRLVGYAENFKLQGFSTVSQERLESFYSHYDDLYSILMLLKQGQQVYQIPQHDLFGNTPAQEQPGGDLLPEAPPPETVPDIPISDHVRMQWTLANLGRKAGSKVWVPSGDQSRIRNQYQFDDFETDFAAGLDTQTKYVENIDVVWKEEYQINAAFEIENSTAIYSGLLRFADLTIVAPNTLYPLFIVAPQEKRNRLIEQLRRPTFQKLRLDRKVRYLPYEAVDKIDSFFEDQERGLTVDVIVGHSEEVHFHH